MSAQGPKSSRALDVMNWKRWKTAAVTAIELLIRFLKNTSSSLNKKENKVDK